MGGSDGFKGGPALGGRAGLVHAAASSRQALTVFERVPATRLNRRWDGGMHGAGPTAVEPAGVVEVAASIWTALWSRARGCLCRAGRTPAARQHRLHAG